MNLCKDCIHVKMNFEPYHPDEWRCDNSPDPLTGEPINCRFARENLCHGAHFKEAPKSDEVTHP